MDRNALRIIVLAAAAGFAGAAAASPIPYSDVWDPADILVTNSGPKIPYTFTHDITDSGFDPLVDNLTSLSLTLRFHNDAPDSQPESVVVTFEDDNPAVYTISDSSTLGVPFILSLGPALSLLQDDGKLQVTLTRDIGDYWFMDSTLEAVAEPFEAAPAAVPLAIPEPSSASLAFLALGMAGWARRRGRAR